MIETIFYVVRIQYSVNETVKQTSMAGQKTQVNYIPDTKNINKLKYKM